MECTHCGQEVYGEELTYCQKCESPHHKHCWESFKQCGLLGCAETHAVLKEVYALARKGQFAEARNHLSNNVGDVITINFEEVLADLDSQESEKKKRRFKLPETITSAIGIAIVIAVVPLALLLSTIVQWCFEKNSMASMMVACIVAIILFFKLSDR